MTLFESCKLVTFTNSESKPSAVLLTEVSCCRMFSGVVEVHWLGRRATLLAARLGSLMHTCGAHGEAGVTQEGAGVKGGVERAEKSGGAEGAGTKGGEEGAGTKGGEEGAGAREGVEGAGAREGVEGAGARDGVEGAGV